ncbi:MAG: hypothetical protein M1814_002209 [Vezdaea aestivalis]|nr:MAG: hypothetical protein M1814_002209 [Vezdaea aestivalis]
MAKKYGLANQYSNYSNIQTYNQDGPLDTFIQKQAEFDLAYAAAQNSSVAALDESEQTDRSMRDALHAAGWDPKGDALAEAVEWYAVDFEYAQTAEVASERHTLANYRSTFHDYSPENNFVTDPRGFAHLIRSQAAEFLAPNDPRLLLSTTVTSITWSGSSVQIQTSDGTCISAEHAINTFSAGVLQSDLVHFNPPLPDWKRQAISKVQMGVYTKIFMQFSSDRIFWPQDTEFFLYADNNSTTNPSSSAPLFHSPPAPFPQDILIATITTGPPSNSNETEAHLLSTLQNMFPGTPIPQPKAFMYPLWNELEWARGSFSNWPVGMTRAEHDALGEPTGNLWFAGEAGSKEYWGFLQGAFEEGKRVGGEVARCVIEGGCKERTEKQGQKVMG